LDFDENMKLIIQIPCYNEEKTLGKTLSALPREVSGVAVVEWLVVDDGSTDRTVQIAKEHGVDHIVSHPKNRGLAKAFMTGLNTSIKLGADIIVNTDADNQYRAEYIPDLIFPLLEGTADMVIGARPIDETKDFSRVKKILQKLGSWTVRLASGTDIPDAPSGFRAISREAARRLNIFDDYTYTLETIIQAGQKDISITWIPVETNRALRPSKLVKSLPIYIYRSILTIVRIFVVYKPFRFFVVIGSVLLTLGVLIGVRFLYFYYIGQGKGHIQSLILGSILIGIGFQTIMTAFIADLISVNRRLLEDIQFEERERKLNKKDKNEIP
jgi:glycosyltransferase involved in cell wall biosynthesis